MRGSPGKGRGTRDRRGGSTESTRLGCYSASAAALRRLLIGLMQTPRRSSLSKRKANCDVNEINESSGPGYKVTKVLTDGRCLFRVIAHGACLKNEEAPDENRDFDTYVKHNQQPYVWGGEPELLMASHIQFSILITKDTNVFENNFVGIVSKKCYPNHVQ
ncbi:hypothetical protein ACOSQ3_022521 [Xanthoceras sorbifolium]